MSEPQERLFFALWPDEDVRQRLSESVNGMQKIIIEGRPVKSSNLHMTLHFVGNVPSAKVGCFLRQATKVQGRPFELRLTQVGHFKNPRVLWTGCESTPAALVELHRRLGILISRCGYTPELRPFRPHVTMARKINSPVKELTIPMVKWRVKYFVLLRSIQVSGGVEYDVIRNFPFKTAI